MNIIEAVKTVTITREQFDLAYNRAIYHSKCVDIETLNRLHAELVKELSL